MIEASGLVLALTTEANAERAQQLAEALLERHLVACVSIHPVQSFYRWEGSLQASHEDLSSACGRAALGPLRAPQLRHPRVVVLAGDGITGLRGLGHR